MTYCYSLKDCYIPLSYSVLQLLVLGHTTCAQGTRCQNLYRVENYRLLAWCYKSNPKSNPLKEATTASVPCSHTFKC